MSLNKQLFLFLKNRFIQFFQVGTRDQQFSAIVLVDKQIGELHFAQGKMDVWVSSSVPTLVLFMKGRSNEEESRYKDRSGNDFSCHGVLTHTIRK